MIVRRLGRAARVYKTALGCAVCIALTWSSARPHASAQRAETDVQAAARAFAEAQRAQLRGELDDAARLYELADSIAPTPEALRSAIRSRMAAGHAAHAATLARAAQRRYPDDHETAALASEVIAKVAPELGELSLRCDEPCSLLCDGRAVSAAEQTAVDFFVAPGAHVLAVRFAAERELEQHVELAAGQRVELQLAPPPPAPAARTRPARLPEPAQQPPAPAASAPRLSVHAEATPADAGPVPRGVFFAAAAVTAASGIAALVSGLDMLEQRERYRRAPTRARYESGVESETRTNVLLVGTGALAALTAGLAFFTDWGGDPAPTLSASPGGAVLALRRSFR